MSPKAGFILLDQIEPRLRATMPYIRGVGSEDTEELLQDALAVAAKMIHDLEERGKEVTRAISPPVTCEAFPFGFSSGSWALGSMCLANLR